MKKSIWFCVGLVFAAPNEGLSATFRWTAAVDNDVFNEANWDPPGLTIDPGVPVNHDLVTVPGDTLVVRAPNLTSTLYLGTGSLTLENASIITGVFPPGVNGIAANDDFPDPANAKIEANENASIFTHFLHDIDLTMRPAKSPGAEVRLLTTSE